MEYWRHEILMGIAVEAERLMAVDEFMDWPFIYENMLVVCYRCVG